MKNYKKRPITIQAEKLNYNNIQELINEIGDDAYYSNDNFYIKTLEGDMKVNIGDYIIKGIKGEYYPCKSDIFESTYDLID
jgi:hypothetical protein